MPLEGVAPGLDKQAQTLNLVRITGQLLEREPLRYTPARLPVAVFRIGHESRQAECEMERLVQCEIDAHAIGPLAHQICAIAPGTALGVEGFLAQRSARSKSLVLHVSKLELLEGTQNGI